MPRLNTEEMDRLLRRNGIVHLAVTTDDGSPLVVPLGYVHRDRQILLTAREGVSWLAHIRRDRSTVTSWRLPIVGEPASEVWASRYYRHEPRRFVVTELGRTMDEVRVTSVPTDD